MRKSDHRRADLVHEVLMLVLSREIPEGAVIDEARLAEAFGLSRTPVREAVNIVAGMLRLPYEPMRGYRTPSLGLPEIRAFFEVAEHIYPEVFGRAAANRRSSDLARIDAHYDEIAAATDPGAIRTRLAAYRNFVTACAAASRNDDFYEIMRYLFDRHIVVRMDMVLRDPEIDHRSEVQRNLQVYNTIREHIRERDVDGVRVAALDRLRTTRTFIIEQMIA